MEFFYCPEISVQAGCRVSVIVYEITLLFSILHRCMIKIFLTDLSFFFYNAVLGISMSDVNVEHVKKVGSIRT